jgi:hypothetical protein
MDLIIWKKLKRMEKTRMEQRALDIILKRLVNEHFQWL